MRLIHFVRPILLFLSLLMASMGYCHIDIRTNIEDVYYRGPSEQIGSITAVVKGDDFYDPTHTQPEYIRIRFSHDATLCHTLVGLESVGKTRGVRSHEPIYIAARLNADPAQYRLNLAPDAISVVRWIAGESQIWLKVTQQTYTWIQDVVSLELFPPSENRSVSFTIGLSAENSWNINAPLYDVNCANLRANSRNPLISAPGEAEDTLFLVDLSQSFLPAMPDPGSVLISDTMAFQESVGVTTASTTSEIIVGVQTANIIGDTAVARGNNLSSMPWEYLISHWYWVPEIDIPYLVFRLE